MICVHVMIFSKHFNSLTHSLTNICIYLMLHYASLLTLTTCDNLLPNSSKSSLILDKSHEKFMCSIKILKFSQRRPILFHPKTIADFTVTILRFFKSTSKFTSLSVCLMLRKVFFQNVYFVY